MTTNVIATRMRYNENTNGDSTPPWEMVFGMSSGETDTKQPYERQGLWPSFVRWAIVAAIMTIPTAILFGPSGGFHHHYGFGIPFCYMVWNGEDPDPESFQFVEGYEVWFDPVLFTIQLAIWIAILAGTIA